MEENGLTELTRTLQVIYSHGKVQSLYYEVITQNLNKPNCCDKWEDKLNKDINWSTTFEKMQRIQEVILKWFHIRLVHMILSTNVVLMHTGVENYVERKGMP